MRNVVDSIIRVLCTAIMGIMVVAVCWQVTTRYILNNPSTVTEEALRYLLVWTTMVGAAYAYGKRKQLSINILLKKVSPSMQKIVDIGVQCLVIVFCIVVMVMGAVLFIFYALIFIGEDVKELRDNRGQFTAEHPIAEQKNSLHLADTPKNENGRNDIS